MKKGLFGYNTKEADELITLLQNQNDDLTAKIAKLTISLSAAEAQPQNKTVVEELNKKVSKLTAEVTQLTATNNDLQKNAAKMKDNNSTLTAQNEELTAEINSLQNSVFNKEVKTRIGDLFGKAYSDAGNLESNVADELYARVDNYAETLAEHNQQMKTAITSTKAAYEEMLTSFASQLDGIFESLSIIKEGSQEIEKSLIPPDRIIKELKGKIDFDTRKSLASLSAIISNSEEAEDDTQNSFRNEQPDIIEKEPESLVNQLKNKYFTNTINGQMISVLTNVSKNDIFYGHEKTVEEN